MTNPVKPVEDHYALLRNGWICMVQIQKGWMKEISDFALSVTTINDQVPLWNLDTGQCLHDSPEYDIIGTISPEAMQAIASGQFERLQEAVILARDTFSHYGDLHAAKPDDHKATANYKLAAKMNAALGEQNDG